MGKTVTIKNGALIKEYFAFYNISELVKSELFSALASDGIEQVLIDLDNKWRYEHSPKGKLYIFGENIIKDMIKIVEDSLKVH